MKSMLALLVALVLLSPPLEAATIRVKTTIQAAVDAAQSGDTVFVPPGLYRENVRVAKDNLTIRGSLEAVLDGTGLGSVGIRVAKPSPARLTGFTLSGMTIQNYVFTGIFLSRVDNFTVSGGRYRDNEEYAIFPVRSTNGLVDHNQVTGSEDSGIYIGQSSDVTIEKNRVSDCRVGFEVENSSQIDVLQNTASDNSIGIFVFVLPLLDVKATSDIRVQDNVLNRNNRLLVRDPGDPFAQIPAGVGLLIIGADNSLASSNIAMHNDSAGIIVGQVPPPLAELDPDIDPLPDHNEIVNNVALANGDDIDPLLAPFPGSDLLWDFTGEDNCWSGNIFQTSFPDELPDCDP